MNATDNGPRYSSAAELESPVAQALLRWGLALADTKHLLGRRLSEWVNGAPALEAAVGSAAMTQDELGHARSLFAMLREFPGVPPELNTETDLDRQEYYNPRLLDRPWDSWLDAIAVNVLLDRALEVAIRATRESQFAPLRQRAGKVLQEEHFHRVFGDGWLARLATRGDETHRRLQAALDRVGPAAWLWFGPPDDPGAERLRTAGILNASPGELRETWLRQVSPLLDRHGLTVPAVAADWSRWDPQRREIPG